MIKFTVLSTKGGVGKTTLAANLGALMADMGLRVLLVDADVQPALSKYYRIRREAPFGLTKVITTGYVTEDCISQTVIDGLDVIRSDDPDGSLQTWLLHRIDRGERLGNALNSPAVSEDYYDCVLIDTQGTVGPLFDEPIVFQRAYVSLTGSAVAALFLSYAIYTTERLPKDAEGWFRKTGDQWKAETGLTRFEQQTARRILRELDVLIERRAGLPAELSSADLPTACSVIPGLAVVRNMYIIIGQGASHAQPDARHQIAGGATHQPGPGSQSVDAGGFSRPG